MKKKYYAIIIENNKNINSLFNSYFGLNEETKDVVVEMLNNLRINYDIYYFLEEKRFKENLEKGGK